MMSLARSSHTSDINNFNYALTLLCHDVTVLVDAITMLRGAVRGTYACWLAEVLLRPVSMFSALRQCFHELCFVLDEDVMSFANNQTKNFM